jgi:hypothetical protein
MEKKVELGMLCDIYGNLLTKRQQSIINDYANEDLSLTEIAENNGITRQAVNDIVKKGEIKLLEYEQKLGVMKKTLNQEKQIQNILFELNKITQESSDKKVEKILDSVRKELISLNA